MFLLTHTLQANIKKSKIGHLRSGVIKPFFGFSTINLWASEPMLYLRVKWRILHVIHVIHGYMSHKWQIPKSFPAQKRMHCTLLPAKLNCMCPGMPSNFSAAADLTFWGPQPTLAAGRMQRCQKISNCTINVQYGHCLEQSITNPKKKNMVLRGCMAWFYSLPMIFGCCANHFLGGGGEISHFPKLNPPKSGHESPPSAPALLPETPLLCQKHRGLLPNGRRIPEPGISRLHGKISKEICDSIGRILSSWTPGFVFRWLGDSWCSIL